MNTGIEARRGQAARVMLAGVLVAALAALAGCGTNGMNTMAQQTEAQIEVAKLRDKEARAEYSDQSMYLGLIAKMQQEGLYFASLAHIEAYQQRFGAGPDIQAMRADALRETGQDDAAIQAYRQLAASGKPNQAARAYHGLGLIAGRQGDFARATLELRQAATLDPINPQIANDLGYALMRAGALQDARVPVMQALQLDAGNPKVVSNAAVWLIADGKRNQANALMQRAALPEPTRAAIRKEADRVSRAAASRERGAPRPAAGNAGSIASQRPVSTPIVMAGPAKPQAATGQGGATP